MAGDYWDKTWNIVVGCDPVSSGCDLCFAIRTGRIRASNPNPAVAAAWAGTVTPPGTPMEWTGVVNLVDARLDDPYHWRQPQRIYITLVGDMFHAKVTRAFLVEALARIATTGRHTYLCTTKRHGIMRSRMNDPRLPELVAARAIQLSGQRGAQLWDGVWPLANLHLSVSVEDQDTAALRIPALQETCAAVRWISAEPLLRRIVVCTCDGAQFRNWQTVPHPSLINDGCPLHGKVRLDWLVTGGESNSHRPAHPDWFRSLRDQCVSSGVPFFFKQQGDWSTSRPMSGAQRGRFQYLGPNGERFDERNPPDMDPTWACMYRVGTKAAGRTLDGRTWDELPAVCHA